MSAPRVHPQAVVDPAAELGPEVIVEAFAVVGPDVRLGKGTRVRTHAVLEGPTTLGPDNDVHPFAVIGGPAQDKRAGGPGGSLVIGARNVFREHVTVHRGTQGRATRIGDDGLFMVGAHVAHDAAIGSSVTLANGVLLAGHVTVEDHVTFGGAAAVAQHVTIGESAFVAGGARVERSVPPFVVAEGDRARVRALNKVGLRRRGVDEAEIAALSRALRHLLFGEGPLAERVARYAADESARVRALAARFVVT